MAKREKNEEKKELIEIPKLSHRELEVMQEEVKSFRTLYGTNKTIRGVQWFNEYLVSKGAMSKKVTDHPANENNKEPYKVVQYAICINEQDYGRTMYEVWTERYDHLQWWLSKKEFGDQKKVEAYEKIAEELPAGADEIVPEDIPF